MPTELPRALIEVNYYQAAQEYLRKLPLEHFMESTPQATQRKITLASLSLVEAQCSDFHLFNELLVQYPLPHKKKKKPGQVVPDNMVVRHDQPIKAEGSYDVPLQPVGPFWVLEYVSKNNRRKDYDDNMRKYEQELKVPYYLLFVPDEQELTLYRHTGEKYATVFPNEEGRYPIPELEIELAILDGWVRYWYRGELLPLPADLMNQLNETKQRLAHSEQQRAQAEQQRAQIEQRLAQSEQQRDEERRQRLSAEEEIARLRAELEKFREQS